MAAAMADSPLPLTLLGALKPRLPEMLRLLRRFVTTESPSLAKAAADRCSRVIAKEWQEQGLHVERLPQKHRGDHLRVTYRPKSHAAGQLLVLGHYDTVYSTGTLKEVPFRISGNKAYGPGTFDMKAGIVQALFALETLQRSNVKMRKQAVFLWTSDEEIGSESSRKLIESEARRSDAVLVLEPSFGPRGLLSSDMRRIERRLHALRPVHQGASLKVTGGFDRPPLEHKRCAALFAHAKSLAKQMHLSLGECTAGGGSDGNFTGAIGIPTLDGLGAVGDAAHSDHEYVLIPTMPGRAALLAALLATC